MKCFYTENEITETGSQIIVCDISDDGVATTPQQLAFKKAFPDAFQTFTHFFNSEKFDIVPRLGDVVWVHTSGNKHIGFCVIRKGGVLMINALTAALKSIKNKADSLNLEYVGMGKFGFEKGIEWSNIVDHIENSLDNIQPIICIPTNEELIDVIDNLPGSKDILASVSVVEKDINKDNVVSEA